jgi:hypothetical protein
MTSNYLSRFKKWLSDGVEVLLFTAGIFTFFLLLSALSWLVLLGLHYLKEHFFIPYPPGSYLHLNGGFTAFPDSIIGIYSIMGLDMPNSMIVLLWGLILSLLLFSLPSNWQDLPAKSKKGQTRSELKAILIKKFTKAIAISSLVFFVLCIPGMRTYQILTADHYSYVDYFSTQEKSLALVDLREVERYKYGRANGLIGWHLLFKDGKDGLNIDFTAPDIQALQKLLALPNVTSNVFIKEGNLYLKK